MFNPPALCCCTQRHAPLPPISSTVPFIFLVSLSLLFFFFKQVRNVLNLTTHTPLYNRTPTKSGCLSSVIFIFLVDTHFSPTHTHDVMHVMGFYLPSCQSTLSSVFLFHVSFEHSGKNTGRWDFYVPVFTTKYSISDHKYFTPWWRVAPIDSPRVFIVTMQYYYQKWHSDLE